MKNYNKLKMYEAKYGATGMNGRRSKVVCVLHTNFVHNHSACNDKRRSLNCFEYCTGALPYPGACACCGYNLTALIAISVAGTPIYSSSSCTKLKFAQTRFICFPSLSLSHPLWSLLLFAIRRQRQSCWIYCSIYILRRRANSCDFVCHIVSSTFSTIS